MTPTPTLSGTTNGATSHVAKPASAITRALIPTQRIRKFSSWDYLFYASAFGVVVWCLVIGA